MAEIEPLFSRGDIAKVLNVTTMTIRNRERRKQYPEPKRDLNDHRIYTLEDVFSLQILTFNLIDPRPILSLLYDKGHRDMKALGAMIDSALAQRKGIK